MHNKLIQTANQLYGKGLRHSGSMMYPGSVSPYHGITPHYLKHFDRDRNWTLNVDTVIDWMTDPVSPANFVSIYFDVSILSPYLTQRPVIPKE